MAFLTSTCQGHLQFCEWHLEDRNLATLKLALNTQYFDLNVHKSSYRRYQSPWQWIVEQMMFIHHTRAGPKSKMSDEEYWVLVEGGFISQLLTCGANAEAVLDIASRPLDDFPGQTKMLCPVLWVYMVWGWKATPPTPS